MLQKNPLLTSLLVNNNSNIITQILCYNIIQNLQILNPCEITHLIRCLQMA